jgi:8-oxo-dGTP diphosphatase
VSGPRVGSAVLITDGPRIVLGRRGKQPLFGKWVLPGGKIEEFESIDRAAEREANEETGLQVAITRRLGVVEIINPPDEHRIIVYSEATPIGGDLCAGSDLLDVRFFEQGELERLDITPTVKSVLQQAGWIQQPIRDLGQVS